MLRHGIQVRSEGYSGTFGGVFGYVPKGIQVRPEGYLILFGNKL